MKAAWFEDGSEEARSRALGEMGGVLDQILKNRKGAALGVPLAADFHFVRLLSLVLEDGGAARAVCQSLCEDLARALAHTPPGAQPCSLHCTLNHLSAA